MEIRLPNLNCRHVEFSLLSAVDDDSYARGSDRLFDLAINSIIKAREIDLSSISARMKSPPYFPDVWPGEHYRLFAAMVDYLQPKQIIEIGTAEGLSALSMLSKLPQQSELVSFDIIPWNEYSNCYLKNSDFETHNFRQIISDLSNQNEFVKYQSLLQSADILFVDAPKDGIFESTFLNQLAGIEFSSLPLVILDDIRLLNMVKLWREIKRPKLDLTSFGHWSGTGLIDWQR